MANTVPQQKKATPTTPLFRVSFNHLWKPSRTDEGKIIYSVTGIFEPDKAALAGMFAEIKSAIDTKWKGKAPAGLRMPIRFGKRGTAPTPENPAGTADEFDFEKYPEYEGKYVATFRSYDRPVGLVDAQRNPILNQDEFYSGCYAIASYGCFVYDRKDGKGVSFGLYNVMKIKDGERLVPLHIAETDFAEIDTSKWGVDASETMFGGETGNDDPLGLG